MAKAVGLDITIQFGAVAYHAEVWLNGVSVGSHRSGNLPFELDVGSALAEGENLLVVRADGLYTFVCRHWLSVLKPNRKHPFASCTCTRSRSR